MRQISTRRCMTLTEVVVLVVCAAVLAFLTALLAPQRVGATELANRAVCANSIRMVIEGMFAYAQTNGGTFPSVAAPSSNFVNGLPAGGAASAPGRLDKKTRVVTFSNDGLRGKQPIGSPLACMWLLVTQQGASPDEFVCPSDPTTIEASKLVAPARPDKVARYYMNFGMGDKGPLPCGHGESYSIAYPWVGGKAAPWWNSKISDNDASSTPLVSDMAPMQDPNAPGHKARDVMQPLSNTYGNYIFNSGNHGGDGQNVGYADDHVVWCNNPYVGVNNDNIFTYGSTSTGGGGTAIAPYLIAPTPHLTDKYPYDTVMVPTRNVQTGRW